MSKLVKLARVQDISEGMPVAVDIPDFPPLAVFRVGETFYVTANRCTHGAALLTDGFQDGTTIECATHGGAFDVRTGEATVFPCQVPLQAFDVTLKDGYVCISG